MNDRVRSGSGDGFYRVPRREEDGSREGGEGVGEASVEGYDHKGRPMDDERYMAAKAVTFGGETVFSIRFLDSVGLDPAPMDPFGVDFNMHTFLKHMDEERKRTFKFKQVTLDQFHLYLSYLQNPRHKTIYEKLVRNLING